MARLVLLAFLPLFGIASVIAASEKPKAAPPLPPLSEKPPTLPPLPNYPPEDLEVYKRSLWVKDPKVRSATIAALTNYTEGFEIVLAFISKYAKSEPASALEAAMALKKFKGNPDYEKRIVELRRQLIGTDNYTRAKLEKSKGTVINLSNAGVKVEEKESVDPPGAKQKLAMELTRRLFDLDSKKYALQMLDVMHDKLCYQGELSTHDATGDEILALMPFMKKDELVPLVPHLLPSLHAFFSDGRKTAYMMLVVITGEAYPFDVEGSKEDREWTAGQY